MKKKKISFVKCQRFALCTYMILKWSIVSAQCQAPPGVLSCNPVGSTALLNNDVVATGQIKTTNSDLSLGTPTISGGMLVVCSNLTITGISFSSGTIVVNPGASLFLNPSGSIVFGSNCTIFNHGVFTSSGSLVTGQNNLIMNCSTASLFNVLFNQLVVQGPNTKIVNYGVINSGYVINSSSNSPNTYCLGPSSMINANIMINQYLNAFTSPSPYSCISIASQIINSQPMTATSNVKVCYQSASVNTIGSANFGSATVNSTCASCFVALPLDLISFAGVCSDETITLNWIAANERNTDYFLVEKSPDGLAYETAQKISAQRETNTANSYVFSEHGKSQDQEIMYYRLKQVDRSGEFTYSPVIYVKCDASPEIFLFPQVIKERALTLMVASGFKEATVLDLRGTIIFRSQGSGEPVKALILPDDIAAGVYVVNVTSLSGMISRKRIIVL